MDFDTELRGLRSQVVRLEEDKAHLKGRLAFAIRRRLRPRQAAGSETDVPSGRAGLAAGRRRSGHGGGAGRGSRGAAARARCRWRRNGQ